MSDGAKVTAQGSESSAEAAYQSSYAEFAKNLRTWFIAYGIGGPILLVTNESFAKLVSGSGNARTIAGLFLFGVALQVATALLWKAAMWYLYLGEIHPDIKLTKRFRVSDWLSEQFWLEIIVDGATLIAFGCATYKVLLIATAEMPAGL